MHALKRRPEIVYIIGRLILFGLWVENRSGIEVKAVMSIRNRGLNACMEGGFDCCILSSKCSSFTFFYALHGYAEGYLSIAFILYPIFTLYNRRSLAKAPKNFDFFPISVYKFEKGIAKVKWVVLSDHWLISFQFLYNLQFIPLDRIIRFVLSSIQLHSHKDLRIPDFLLLFTITLIYGFEDVTKSVFYIFSMR